MLLQDFYGAIYYFIVREKAKSRMPKKGQKAIIGDDIIQLN